MIVYFNVYTFMMLKIKFKFYSLLSSCFYVSITFKIDILLFSKYLNSVLVISMGQYQTRQENRKIGWLMDPMSF